MITKTFTDDQCLVEFTVPVDETNFETIAVVGDFNNWDATKNPLQRDGNTFKTVIALPLHQDFQFHYVGNADQAFNDENADDMVSNPYGESSGVISTHPAERAE